jgi:hypothetical protein
MKGISEQGTEENIWTQKKKLRGFSPQANYTNQAIAASQRS